QQYATCCAGVGAAQESSVSQAWTSKLPLRPKELVPIVMPPFRSTPKCACESTQPEACSVARPKKSASPVKLKNHSPSCTTSETNVSPKPAVTCTSPPTTTCTVVEILITSRRLTVPLM